MKIKIVIPCEFEKDFNKDKFNEFFERVNADLKNHRTITGNYELESDGYVKKSSEGGFDDGSCEIYCIHGYALTKKGYEHKYYKDALEKEIEWWNKQNKKEEVEE